MLLDLMWWSVHWSELESQLINRSRIGLSGEPLHERSGETSWEGESTKPEDKWCSLDGPLLEEFVSLTEIVEPVRQRLHGEVTFSPYCWYLVQVDAVDNILKIRSNSLHTS